MVDDIQNLEANKFILVAGAMAEKNADVPDALAGVLIFYKAGEKSGNYIQKLRTRVPLPSEEDWETLRKFVAFINKVRLQLHGAIYRLDSFVLMARYCANLKAIRYESTSFNRIVADKSHRVIAA